MTAAVFVSMGAVHLGAAFVSTDIGQQVKQSVLEIRCIVHSKIMAGVVDDAIRRTSAIRFLNQKAIDCHLKDMRVIGSLWCPTGFNFNRYDVTVLLNEIIRLAGKSQIRIVKRFLDRPPGASIGIDDPSARETGGAALAPGDQKQGEGEQEGGKAEVKKCHRDSQEASIRNRLM
jgi:hypothetical protein